ncbi:hypothetical protein [Rubrivirga sp.]|uniref:hypothetical protein n=1 Tax=Rubrivirga sp. TaxID=1885344 RepID=UPI003B524A70
MTLLRRAFTVAEAVLPDRVTFAIEDQAHTVRFDRRARAFRREHGFQPAARTLTILTYPDDVVHHPDILLGKLCAALGYRTTFNPRRPFDVAVKYHDQTFTDPSALAPIPAGRPVINAGSLDISKVRVDREFEAVFGMSTLLDPSTHVGPMVEKPDLNSAQGRSLVTGPMAPRPGFVYQRLLDSTTGDGRYVEYRVPIHDGRFPLVYRKTMQEEARFTKVAERAEIIEPEADFSADELDRVRTMCRAMGLDYGELDVIRDRESGVPVVIDVNNTPYGALKGLDETERRRAIRTLAASFQTMCESRLPSS